MSTDLNLSNHLPHDEFFAQLTALFETRKSKSHGSIFLTQKRLSALSQSPHQDGPATQDDPALALDPLNPPAITAAPILIRATNGKGVTRDTTGKITKGREGKVRISTVVRPEELEKFFERYAGVCREGMGALKRKERKTKRRKGGKKEE